MEIIILTMTIILVLHNNNSSHSTLYAKLKVKTSHTRCRALGPELIPVYRQSACRWLEAIHPVVDAIIFRQACSYLPSRTASPLLGRY